MAPCTGSARRVVRSPPAMKPRPLPHSTAARTLGSAAMVCTAARKALAMGTSMALSASGRLKRSVAMAPLRSSSRGAVGSAAVVFMSNWPLALAI
ncbi:hypothetical protein D3C71_1674130 [compost metagenome]